MKRYEIHASLITTTHWGDAKSDPIVAHVEAMSLSLAIQLVRMTLQQKNPGSSVFVDREASCEVAA